MIYPVDYQPLNGWIYYYFYISLKTFVMTKKLIILIVGVFAFANTLFAQEEGMFRVGMDLGYTVPSDGGGGLLFYLEPKYNIQDNLNIGVRIGMAAMVRNLHYYSVTDDLTGKVSANASIALTADYYFNTPGKNFAPFVGGGFGYMSFASLEFDTGFIDEAYEGNFDERNAIAPFIRAGFESGKFRLSLDYNIVPKSIIVNSQGQEIGDSGNSYLGIAIGFFVGGGKWRN
jgi:outer membrane protein W